MNSSIPTGGEMKPQHWKGSSFIKGKPLTMGETKAQEEKTLTFMRKV